jgi:glycosyltransferase involved in cell wall biosynthesis
MQKNYSFVIPHHNTPALLDRLVRSIPQREDIEIIVVDDNSDDDKKATIDRPDVRVIFIDREHTRGAGHARNVGMDVATGKWLLFADADDFYNPGFLEVLDDYKDASIDILFFNVNSVNSDTLQPIESRSRLIRGLIQNYDGTPARAHEILFLCYTPWRRMQRLDFVRRHGIRFEEIPKGNDVFFTYLTGYFVKSWQVDSRIVYTVTYSSNSMSYGPNRFKSYKNSLLSLRKRSRFFDFIGHAEWNSHSVRGRHEHSVALYLLRILKHQPVIGLKAMCYYLTHFVAIERKSNYYIDEIKRIEQNL